jgi:hypothetical protein
MQKGQIYVAPPDFHMIVDPGFLRIIRGPLENHSRPAIDPTFRCRVGHAYTAEHLRAERRQAVKSALWSALQGWRIELGLRITNRLSVDLRSAHRMQR